MTAVVDTVQLTRTETVVVQDFYPESVSLTHTERVVERTEDSRVVVTGVLAPVGQTTVTGAADVDLSNLSDGAVLVYQANTAKWQATRMLENQVMNGGFF
jgi:hypothetical protein